MRRLSLLILLFGWAATADAGNLYRCVGSDGIPNYTSKKVAGSSCVVVAKTAPQQYSPPPPQAVPAATVTPTSNAKVETTDTPAATVLTAASAPQAANASTGSTPKFLRMGQSTTYSYTDQNGIKNFSNRRPKGVSNVVAIKTEYAIFSQPSCYACAVPTSVSFGSLRLNTNAYAAEIKAASLAYGVEEAIVRAIIHAESAYRPHVQSNKGAQGLMQLIPATARRFGVNDSFDPGQNINGGVQYLSWLLRRYQQDLTLAAAAYNAGEGAVDRYGGVPPYKETRLYVARVGQLAERYRKAL
ncbi:MAG: lytic transglycosylase domain-containing protein [Arenimonas sp.]